MKCALPLAALILGLAIPAFAQEGAEETEPSPAPRPSPAPAAEAGEDEETEAPAARTQPAQAPQEQPAPPRQAPEAQPQQAQPRQAQPRQAQPQQAQPPAQQPRQAQPAQEPAPQPATEQSPRPVLRQAPQPEIEATGAEALGQPSDEEMDQALDQALDQGIADDDLFDPETAEAVGDHIADQQGVVADDEGEPVEALEVGAAAETAHGEHGEHDVEDEAGHEAHFDAAVFGMQALNFLVFIAIVVFLARKPLGEFLRNRRLAVEEGLEEAKRVKEEATAKYDEYSERLERLDEELAKLRQEMVEAGEAERDRIIAEAEARAARMRKDAQFVIDQQMKQLRADLTQEAIVAAVAAAEKVLVEQTNPSDQQKLAEAYLAKLDEEVRA